MELLQSPPDFRGRALELLLPPHKNCEIRLKVDSFPQDIYSAEIDTTTNS